jgi:hypothetical protein
VLAPDMLPFHGDGVCLCPLRFTTQRGHADVVLPDIPKASPTGAGSEQVAEIIGVEPDRGGSLSCAQLEHIPGHALMPQPQCAIEAHRSKKVPARVEIATVNKAAVPSILSNTGRSVGLCCEEAREVPLP